MGEDWLPNAAGDFGLAPRRAQILAPLLAVAVSDEARQRILSFGGTTDRAVADKNWLTQKRVLSAARKLLVDASAPLTVGAVAKQFDTDWRNEYGVEVTHRWVGSVLRRLGVEPQKSNGVYVVPVSDFPLLRTLFVEYQIGDDRDVGDVAFVAIDPAQSKNKQEPR